MSTRDDVMTSWRAAQRVANAIGALPGNVASVAGQYLELANGDARVAADLLPDAASEFWSQVRRYLRDIVQEDSVARTSRPPAAEGGATG